MSPDPSFASPDASSPVPASASSDAPCPGRSPRWPAARSAVSSSASAGPWSPVRPPRPRVPRRVAPVAVAALTVLLALPAAAAAQDPNATDLTQEVTRNGETLTMRLHKVPLRGPHFEIKVQKAGGGYDTAAPAIGERAFLGTVDGRPGAVASGIVTADGTLRGQISFDRGATWFTSGATVTGTRGLGAQTYKWPTTPTMATDLTDGRMRAWDLAVDLETKFMAARGGSVAAALEAVEYSLSNVRAIYMRDTGLMPRVARIVVRAAPAADPYAPTPGLGLLRTEWRANQTDAIRDEAMLVDAGNGGGGVAYAVNFDPNWTYARSGADADGSFDVVARHEIGHNFDADDNQAGNAEGATIMNGNAVSRFSGTELQPILASRTARLSVFDDLGRWADTGLPPYAAMDLADGVAPGTTATVDVLVNDHDANAQALTLTAVDATTKAGGSARIVDGKVAYTAPAGAYGLDAFGYTVTDTCGQTATGLVLARAPGAATDATSAGGTTTGTVGVVPDAPGRSTCAVAPNPDPGGGGAPGPGATPVGTTTTGTTPGGATGLGSGAAPGAASSRLTAKLGLRRASISRGRRTLSVLAPITRRASGTATIELRAAGRTTRTTVAVAGGAVRKTFAITAAQARLGTGIVTVRYPGDADVRPASLRLRAASAPARLVTSRPTIVGGRLRASGRVAAGARGAVRVTLEYEVAGKVRTLTRTARIARGRWSLGSALPASVRSAIGARTGSVQGSVAYTGRLRPLLRGEQRSFQVLGAR